MVNTWIVVADSARALIYTVERPTAPLHLLEALEHPESRSQNQDMDSDRPGRSFDSAGEGRHAMVQSTDPKEYEALRFARELAERLETARNRGELGKLYLVAAPHFLGLLRKALSTPAQHLVVREVAKNLAAHDPADIRAHLPERL